MPSALTIRPLLLVSLLTSIPALAQQQARVEAFSPSGQIKQVRQVQVRFSEAMVPFGDPRAVVEPFVITCSEKGSGRWVDTRNWVYDFDHDLAAGVRCEFRLRDGLKTLAGKELSGTRSFAFSTGGPAVISSFPYQGSEHIDEEQVFLLELDGAATEESILRNVYFTVAGISERVGVRILAAKEREPLLKAHYRWSKEKLQQAINNPLSYPLIRAKLRFPADAKVSLVWGKGVATTGGVATDQDQILPFITRSPFTASFHCTRESPQSECVPITPLRISFSAPVLQSQAKKIILRGPGEKSWPPGLGAAESEDERFVYGVTFNGPFPEKSSFTIEIPQGITDDAGRKLTNADKFPMTVKTDEYPPLAKFAADFGILELKADPMLPVTLRNVEPQVSARRIEWTAAQEGFEPPKPLQPEFQRLGAVTGNMEGRVFKVPSDSASRMLGWIQAIRRRTWEDRTKSVFRDLPPGKTTNFSIPKLQGPKAFEVVGIPLKEPGFYVVEIQSELLGAGLLGVTMPMYVPTTVLVTNLSVHFKWGGDSSLVWVTTLDDAKPAPSAEIQIRDCEGTVLWEGRTDANGLARVAKLPGPTKARQCTGDSGLLVSARLGEDMAFVHTSWSEGIEPWRFHLPFGWQQHYTTTHTILDRSLFRAGETVHMKHVARKHGTAGFSLLGANEYDKRLVIQHIGSEQRYELPLKWDAKGIAETTWMIPKDARLGQYQIVTRQEGPQQEYTPPSGEFRVEDFRVPLMKGIIRPPSEPQVAPSSVPIDLTVNYLGGGGAAMLPVRFRYAVRPRFVSMPDAFEGFAFSLGRVREGITRGEPEMEEAEGAAKLEITRTDLTLDKAGSVRTAITKLPKIGKPMEIGAELEFRDPNGEVQTVSSQVPLWSSKRNIGIKLDSWTLSKDTLRFQVAVLDLSGRPVADAPVKVDLFEVRTYSHRKRLVGGFYAYEHSTETKRVATQCEGRTDKRGLLFCEKPSPVSGNVVLQAVTHDEAGREIATFIHAWVAGKGEWWFRAEDGDRIDLIPEKKRYEPGETARFQVRMPFRKATALITAEREGVGDTFIRELSGKEPVVEIPIKGSYAPNMFISAFVVRGRVGDVQPTATVDLGRPAYKLGVAEIDVGWKAYELKVKVTTDKPVYKVREKAKVALAVTTPDGKPPARGAEVALAAVDEGLLELMPNQSWQLLEGMMGRRSYGVFTSTAQMHVVGKRHFGLKALPQGGGGGRQTTRELFDTLLLWQGRIPLDANGKASVEVPLNDSLTSFRIVAIANAGIARFGTGSASIRSTQDLIIFSGISPLVRQGDMIRPEFTLRNATDQPLEVRVSGRIKEIAEQLPPATVSLPPAESRVIGWDIKAPAGVDSLHYELEASAGEQVHDRLSVAQKVVAAVPVRIIQATLAQVEGEIKVAVERPKDALPSQGGINVALRPSLLNGLTGVTEYMSRYPYSCLEQDVSKAIALRDSAVWGRIMNRLPAYLDGDGLAKYWPSMRLGSDALTAYVLAIGHEAGWQIPENSKQRMLNGLRGFVEGRVIRWSVLPTVDLTIRKLAAIDALSRYADISPSSGVNQVPQVNVAAPAAGRIDGSLLSSIAIEPNLWPTSAVIDWLNILRRIPTVRNRDQRAAEAEQILRSRLNLQGTTMGFSTESSDCLWWLMVSVDTNAVRMILTELDSPAWKEDIPRLVRGALGRQRRGHWDTTVANAWGVLSMEKFSKAFENAPVTGTSMAALSGRTQSVDWAATPKGKDLLFDWPAQRSPLSVTTSGSGRPWATVQSLAAIPLKAPLSTGFKINRTLSPVEQRQQGVWSKGDIVRVRLELESQADMAWVVVSDPIPSGAAVLGTGLGRDSQLATAGEESRGWVWPSFEERSFEAFRSYYEFVPKGSWMIEYTMRLNAEGTMNLPPTRVEAMYSPEMFGEIPNEPMQVR